MKEQHLDEALAIRAQINGLEGCRAQVESNLWTICRIGQADTDHQYASVALNADEELMRSIARKALLFDIVQQIATRRQRLKAIGVELEEDRPTVKEITHQIAEPKKEAA